MDLMGGLLSLRDLFDKDKIAKLAEQMPTPEQNIDMLKNGAMGLLSKAQNGASQLTDKGMALKDQAMQAYQNYMNPPAPVPQTPFNPAHYEAAVEAAPPRWLAPDGSGEMWTRQQFDDYFARAQDAFRKQYDEGLSRAPTRAAWRRRQQGLLSGD